MRKILESLHWWELSPDQGLFAGGVGNERTLNTAMRSPKGDRALVYLSSQCTVFLNVDKISNREARITWINPATGERKQAGVFRTGNLNGKSFPDGQAQHFSTPGHWEDALLLLEGVDEARK